jgi:hypothetical protein
MVIPAVRRRVTWREKEIKAKRVRGDVEKSVKEKTKVCLGPRLQTI